MFSGREITGWLLVAAGCLGVRIWFLGGNLFDDSYQYISIAHNIQLGHGASTSIPFFETELHQGVIPAPSTHFPPGYSFLIRMVSVIGLSNEIAGYAISFLSFVALVPCFLYFAQRLGISPGATRIALSLLCLNQTLMASASSVVAEPVFTVLTLAALLIVDLSQNEERGSAVTAALAGALVASTYWVRYAGLIMFGMLALLCVLRLIQHRRRQFNRAAVAFFSAFLCIAPLLARNEMLVGSWRGYITKNEFHPSGILKIYLGSMYHLFFGGGLLRQTAPLAAVCLICLIGLGVAAFRRQVESIPFPASIPALFAAVYTIGIIYLGVTSDITFSERMFIPLLPVLLLLAAAYFRKWDALRGRTTVAVMASIIAVTYGAANLIGSSLTRTEARHRDVEIAISGRLRAIVDGDPGILVSADGQAAGYALNRPVVGLVGTRFANTKWTEDDLHELMRRYGACRLLLFPGRDTNDGQQTSPFLSSLTVGEYPAWLRVEALNDKAILYRSDCEAGAPKH